jgi:predicted nuclease of predicted toxin-antitoxin system
VKRLLLDQGLPRSTAALLSQGGWDVIHVSEIGMSRADDTQILQRARADSRVCVTLDADFHSLLATSGERGPSVMRIRKEGLDATVFAAPLQAIWPRVEDALTSGALVTVTERSIRVRRLPIVKP